jgi:hypothetical protein
MTTFSDGIKLGNRKRTGKLLYPKSSMVYVDFVPATLDRDGLCVSQTTAGAAFLTLTGALTSGGVGILDSGVDSYGRCVGIYSAADLSGVTFTVRGFDVYNEPMTETITGPDGDPTPATTAGLKAFKRVTSVYASGAVATGVEVGTIDKFGLPFRLSDLGQVVRVGWTQTLADNAATVAVGVTTDPATATTGDVRGTVIPSSAANGTRRLVVVYIPDLTNSVTQYGIRQYATGTE